MKKPQGFSLIEILVALFIVSLTAVNITGLQKLVSNQQRDNLTRSLILSVATEKMEEVLTLGSIDDLVAMDEVLEEDIQVGHSTVAITWDVSSVDSDYNAGDEFREVAMEINWEDANRREQSFTHSEQVNLDLLLTGASGIGITDPLADIVVSTLQTNDVIYFEPKMGYKKGSFVIYDSVLYQATEVHSVGNGHPRTVTDPETGLEQGSDGWYSYGPINNEALADNEDLATLFLD